MASIASNVITSGLRGKLGDALVFKTMRGKTFVSSRARVPDKRKESAAQRSTRSNFREASGWAQSILLDTDKKAYYQKRARALKLPNAYTAALTDYMRKVQVEKAMYRESVTYTVSKRGFSLQKVGAVTSEDAMTPVTGVSIRQLHDRWLVQYKVQAGQAPSIQLIITDNCEKILFIDV